MSDAFLIHVKDMLIALGANVQDFTARACREGGNNLVYEIDLGSKKYLAKQYYRSESDTRDRLGAEWSFISYAAAVAPRHVPKAIAQNVEQGIGLYEFVEGRKLKASELAQTHIDAAIEFFTALNSADRPSRAGRLPIASEACFSISDHLDLIDRRLMRLQGVVGEDALAHEARNVVGALDDQWRTMRGEITHASASLRTGFSTSLPADQHCVSPSDFGFHNALLRPDGGITFIDFEYAGWDDPAKTVADFFCQPQVPVDMAFFDRFLDGAMAFSSAAEDLKVRARLLFPAQKVKWACIMLNDFLPDAARRRRFAQPDADTPLRKRRQLDKVGQLLRQLMN